MSGTERGETVRERLAAVLHAQQPDKSAHWSQVKDPSEKAGMYRLADAILADPALAAALAEHEGCVPKADYDAVNAALAEAMTGEIQVTNTDSMRREAALRTEREALRAALTEIASAPSSWTLPMVRRIAQGAFLARTDTGGQE